MKKRLITLMLAMMMASSLCACGFSVGKTTKLSDTGVVSETHVNSSLKLNFVSHDFPEGCTFEIGDKTTPIGMTLANVYYNDELIGDITDGRYTEEITEKNFFDAMKDVVINIKDVSEDAFYGFDDASYLKTSNVMISNLSLTNGMGWFFSKVGTDKFVYVEVTDKSTETMEDALLDALKVFGEEDGKSLINKFSSTEKVEEKSEDKEEVLENEEILEEENVEDVNEVSEDTEMKEMYIAFSEGQYPISMPTSWTPSQLSSIVDATPLENVDTTYENSFVELNNEAALKSYLDALQQSVETTVTPYTLTIPCSNGDELTAYAFTYVKDTVTYTKILQPVLIDYDGNMISTYLSISIRDYTGAVDFAQYETDMFVDYVNQFLISF